MIGYSFLLQRRSGAGEQRAGDAVVQNVGQGRHGRVVGLPTLGRKLRGKGQELQRRTVPGQQQKVHKKTLLT